MGENIQCGFGIATLILQLRMLFNELFQPVRRARTMLHHVEAWNDPFSQQQGFLKT